MNDFELLPWFSLYSLQPEPLQLDPIPRMGSKAFLTVSFQKLLLNATRHMNIPISFIAIIRFGVKGDVS